ncbi:hypothetical protein AVEN_270513-1 [Araneus ventricosus]|uniref:Uncharacterized protein n=1 Tax=Araneus ventricosus TaxID=182803 RepID=A0A4Y2B7G5_ARAVE|nr:hypothetical protein AVEN_270513-1 [Araneus ventricosus]
MEEDPFSLIQTLLDSMPLPQRTTGIPCSEQNMKDCEFKAIGFLHSVNESENGYNYFCDNLRNNSECPMEVDEDCRNQYPTATTLYLGFLKEMVRWCNRSSPDRKAWFKVAFCARKHPKEFQRCYKMKGKWFNNGTFDCRYWDFVACWSQQVAKNCGKEAEALSKYIDDDIPEIYQEYCYGCSGTIRSHWILNLLAFLSLLLSYKTQHLIIENTGFDKNRWLITQ